MIDVEENKSISIIHDGSVNEDATSMKQDTTKKQNKPWYRSFRWSVEDHSSPKEIYNWTLYMSVFVFGILGAARGYDEGNIAGNIAQVSFNNYFGLADPNKSAEQIANLKSNITSMVQLGCIGGALIAAFSVDYLGRVRALQLVCCIWIVGVIIQLTSQSIGQLYAGRLIEGLAIGQTTTIGPTYLSEVSPKAIRGLCGCIFAGAVYFGIMLAYFANYGTALHISSESNRQWIIPTSIKLPLAGSIFVLSFFFCMESPRFLMRKGKPEAAVRLLARLRGLPEDHPYVLGEISDINEQLLAEKEATSKRKVKDLLKEVFLVKSIRYRFFAIAFSAQILGQWSGANAVTIYASELFSLSGIQGVDVLKMTAVLGVVKFIGAYFSAFFLIDIFGRRKTLYAGITIQGISMLYYAIFLNIVPSAADSDIKLTGSKLAASKGALAAIYFSGIGWVCGFNSIQYLLGSEIFPLNIRSFAQSCVMVFHFANQYGNSKALPKMMLAMNSYGAFYFFCAISLCSIIWAWFFVPEISGRSLESMEEIFNLPWYLVGRRGAQLCPDYSQITSITVNKYGTGNSYNGMMNYEMNIEKITKETIEDVENAEDNEDNEDNEKKK